MRKAINGILVGLGFVFFAIGTVGIFLPILPTVKFYLIALVCFTKGSPRFRAWFMRTKLYKKHLESFVKGRGMKLKTKIAILVPVTLVIGFMIARMDILPMRIMLGVLLAVKHYIFWFRIKTLDAKAEEAPPPETPPETEEQGAKID